MSRRSTPTLTVISGPPGSGKTTLAHVIARAISCPAVCRDEIKEGMVHAFGSFTPSPGDDLTVRTYATFFEVLHLLLSHGVSVVAEAAFQDKTWRPDLQRLTELSKLRIVQCHTEASTARRRIIERAAHRAAHADAALIESLRSGESTLDDFQRLLVGAPSLDVDTTSGYEPGIEAIVGFINEER